MTFDVVQYSRRLSQLLDANASFVIVTLIDIRGSAPQIIGAKAIITAHGIESGTVGGGRIEATAIRHAQQLLNQENGTNCEFVTWNLQTDIGMTCGGEVKLFFEVCGSDGWSIAVFGAGHIAQALIPMLVQLNCRVNCFDSRPDWLAKLPSHPKLVTHCPTELYSAVKDQPVNTFFLLMTQGHASDLPVLTEILQTRDAPYVGVIGSPQKASVLRRELREQAIPSDKIDSFYCPVGVPLGNNTPAEISISVIAQLLQQRDELGILKHKVKQF
ncbi:MAG: xanthine dehydrogenase accessory protein XdhC [Fuerstiella sp.]|nr:xanthine dehydrogenase accessory protein XdhC [Fuerstiella sp.]